MSKNAQAQKIYGWDRAESQVKNGNIWIQSTGETAAGLDSSQKVCDRSI